YLLTIILLLFGECIVCIIAVFWPHILGIDVRSARLIRALQRSYAVPGREQFTAALDLAQTIFACCGINGSSNYGTSWWRLREVGRRELVVPLSCCILNNTNEMGSFLNPQPANLTLCQVLNPAEHQYARHTMTEMVRESSVSIPDNIQCFLQLGDNFALPNTNKKNIIFDCII
ncbi:PREDICTED: tetraspanin-15-like, partial [Cyphomyrmex costatus]|uniref:tetraspanin-15-like n=1 Tax=Cyphomyrmex costatus TaxID=456900 RepID=UPI00085222F7